MILILASKKDDSMVAATAVDRFVTSTEQSTMLVVVVGAIAHVQNWNASVHANRKTTTRLSAKCPQEQTSTRAAYPKPPLPNASATQTNQTTKKNGDAR